MAPATPKSGSKRASTDGLAKDAAPKVAKENEEQTATQAATEAVKVDFKDTDTKAVPAEGAKAAETANTEITEQQPVNPAGGDPLAAAANGGEKKGEEKTEEKKEETKTATAAENVETTKATEKTEKAETEEGGKKVAHEGIAEGKSTKDVE